jgi:HEPN domain-containing protein
MVDADKHVAHWRAGAEEDFAAAGDLMACGRIRHSLFFAHLAIEKAIKPHICRHTGDLAPRLHNLLRLLEKTGLVAPPEHLGVLEEMDAFNIEGRYPDYMDSPPDRSKAEDMLIHSEEVLRWLMSRL